MARGGRFTYSSTSPMARSTGSEGSTMGSPSRLGLWVKRLRISRQMSSLSRTGMLSSSLANSNTTLL